MRAWHRPSGTWPALFVAAASAIACGTTTHLIGERTDDGSTEVVTDADAVSPGETGAEDAAEVEDLPPPGCPLWVATTPRGPFQVGTKEDPRVGLQEALDARGECCHLMLLCDPEAPPFNLAVDVELRADERLTIEGDVDAGDRAILTGGAGESDIRAWGTGTLVLRRLAVQGGHAPRGGCLDAEVSALELSDTQWAACEAVGSGGAVFVEASSVTVMDSEFVENVASGQGGAIAVDNWTEDCHLEVAGSRFRGNTAEEGGGIAVLVPTLDVVISSSRFVDNSADWGGAAISGYLGGRIVGNRFEGNRGGSGGGAVAGQAGWRGFEILQNVFVDNQLTVGPFDPDRESSPTAGAALALEPSFATIRNNVFVRNVAEYPEGGVAGSAVGGIWSWGGAAQLWNNTFVDNSAQGDVSGSVMPAHLYLDAAEIDLRDNVFVGGSGELAIAVPRPVSGFPVIAYNDTWAFDGGVFPEGTVLGPGMIAADPRFVDPAGDDYRLEAGSPCRDSGDPDPLQVDPDGSRNDMGAFGGPQGDWTPLGPEGDP